MKPIHVSVIAGLSVAMFGAAQAELEGSVHVGINTEYIWRGVDQSSGNSDSMIEAGLDLGLGSVAGWDVGVNVWYASMQNASGFNEVDYSASASRSFGCVDTSLTYISYDYPGNGAADTEELALGLSRELLGGDVGFTYFMEIEGDNDGYSELTYDRSFAICDACTLGLGATIAYDFETSDVHHYGLSAVVNYAVNDVLTVSPYVSATFAEDGAQNGAISAAGQDDELFGGLLVSAAF
ncbi:MAG: hypothetical protein OSA48_09145 [Akkermansiaceae bacterium]|nr:hypothetical protein [Akkermansiaceae bacterium]